MIRLLPTLLVPLGISLAGCSEPEPAADPAAVDRLVASFETPAGAASGGEEGGNETVPGSIEKKVEKADRLADTLVKVEPDRVDPDLAATLIAR
jgi:hypothetical protein